MAGTAVDVTKYRSHTVAANPTPASPSGQTDPPGFLTHVAIATPSNFEPVCILNNLSDLPVP